MDLLKRNIYQSSNNDIINNIINAKKISNDYELEFIGTYRDPNFDKILYNKENGKFINVYRPLLYLRDHNDLRTIN